jgi:hypothetical protein
MPRFKTTCLLAALLLLIALPAARAQTTDLAERLPADTLLYVYWRGAKSLTPGSQNALVSLWNDPGFESARQLILQSLEDAASQDPRLSRIPTPDIDQLLADPFVFGVRLAGGNGSANGGQGAKATGFLVMQPEGKAGQVLRADLRSGPKSPANFRFTPSGLLIASGDRATLDELVRQFATSGHPGANALSTLDAFREARTEIPARPAIEFFMRVPKAASLAPRKTSSFNTIAFLRSLHLERVHALCGSIDLSAPAAVERFAILGNASPGSLFDLFGTNVTSFSTLAAAPAGASIAIYRFDIGAVLSLLTNAFSSALAPQDAARLQIISALLSSTVVPALGGEYAVIWPRLGGNSDGSILAMAVNSQAAQSLLSSTLAPFVRPDGQEGEIQYFTSIRNSPMAGKSGSADAPPAAAVSAQSALIALTPNLAIIGRNGSLVRSRARAVTSAKPSPGLAASPAFRAERADLPAELSGLSYFDLHNFGWTKWLDQIAANMAKNKKDPHAAERAGELEKWADSGGGAVLARHLHLIAAGAWKDSRGIHWLGNIH